MDKTLQIFLPKQKKKFGKFQAVFALAPGLANCLIKGFILEAPDSFSPSLRCVSFSMFSPGKRASPNSRDSPSAVVSMETEEKKSGGGLLRRRVTSAAAGLPTGFTLKFTGQIRTLML